MLVLHNGQAEVEHDDFRIDRENMKDNMSEMKLVLRRILRDYVKATCLETFMYKVQIVYASWQEAIRRIFV